MNLFPKNIFRYLCSFQHTKSTIVEKIAVQTNYESLGIWLCLSVVLVSHDDTVR